MNYLLYISIALQCLTGITFASAVYCAWTGINKNKAASAEETPANGKKNEPGNTWLTIATLFVIATMLLGSLGFATSAFSAVSSSSVTTQTTPAPDANQPNLSQPDAPKPVFEAPGDMQVNETTIYANFAYIRADVTYFNEAHTSGDVYINFSDKLPENMKIGPAYDGNDLHERFAFTSADGVVWPTIYKDACNFAVDIRHGYFGSTDFNVYYPNGSGGYLPMNEVPDCKRVPLYTGD